MLVVDDEKLPRHARQAGTRRYDERRVVCVRRPDPIAKLLRKQDAAQFAEQGEVGGRVDHRAGPGSTGGTVEHSDPFAEEFYAPGDGGSRRRGVVVLGTCLRDAAVDVGERCPFLRDETRQRGREGGQWRGQAVEGDRAHGQRAGAVEQAYVRAEPPVGVLGGLPETEPPHAPASRVSLHAILPTIMVRGSASMCA
ncbi:hypothetical protein ABT235_24610 [Micromonospora echinofusca]|uniref:hypothetical protein n=1 Tax=Micromonospora echinofusca TaxID=47858 RepID=UPI003318EBEE